MASAVSESLAQLNLGLGFLTHPGPHVSVFRRDLLLQHRPHAEASSFPHSNHRPRRIRRSPGPDWSDSVRSHGKRPSAGYFLVLGQSCGLYVHVYLVSWHVPTLSL